MPPPTFHNRSNGKADSAAVRQCIKDALATGTAAAVRLDAMVANHLGGDSMITARWTRDRRVERRRPQLPRNRDSLVVGNW